MDFGNRLTPLVITGSLPGKNLCIFAGIHGDEPCGIEAIEEILPSLSILRGTVTFVVGNPAAVRAGKRFIESNLNRLFLDPSNLTEEQRASIEYSRAQELLPILEKCDALLDIHSSGTPGSIPFAICESNGFAVAKELPVELITSGWDLIQPGGTDYFVNKSGGIGICVECGYHKDPMASTRAKEAIFAFLNHMDAIDESGASQSLRTQEYLQVFERYITRINFKPARRFSDFEALIKNEVVGNDGEEEVRAPEDCIIIFARDRKNPNEEGFLLAREIKQ